MIKKLAREYIHKVLHRLEKGKRRPPNDVDMDADGDEDDEPMPVVRAESDTSTAVASLAAPNLSSVVAPST